MSDRIAPVWTKTTTEAFGDNSSTRKGIEAEIMYFEYAQSIYDDVEYFPDNYQMQIRGIDVRFMKAGWTRPYSTDVKGNMWEDGTFFIDNTEEGWLRNSRYINDRVCHICVHNGNAYEYDRVYMMRRMNDFPRKLLEFNRAKMFVEKPYARKFTINV